MMHESKIQRRESNTNDQLKPKTVLGTLNQLSSEDLDELRELVELNRLDASDLGGCNLEHFFGVKLHGTLISVGGLEIFGKNALLRSIATSPEHRQNGLALKIVHQLEERASRCGVSYVFLLTETASSFFEKIGYGTVARSTAPDEIRATTQFSDLCSKTALLMNKKITE